MTQERACLETPATAGYRNGLSSTGVIGRKLGAMYQVEHDMPRAFDTAIQAVCRKINGR